MGSLHAQKLTEGLPRGVKSDGRYPEEVVNLKNFCSSVSRAFDSKSESERIPDPKRTWKVLKNLRLTVHVFEFYDTVHGGVTLALCTFTGILNLYQRLLLESMGLVQSSSR